MRMSPRSRPLLKKTPFSRSALAPGRCRGIEGKILDAQKYHCALGQNKNLFAAMVDFCNADGEGFVDYTYEKPAADGTSRQQDIVR
jgi:hypothetical protein